jgi:vacuolar-type H+-ATPase subunit I/STV1
LHGLTEERDRLTAELEEARELLRQAERVRESQIALEAERDRLKSELEQLQTIATEAQAEAEERTRLLVEEQDRHHVERQTLLAQRTVLEEELGSSIEQLAAANTAADEREARLQLGSQRLIEALDAVRRLAAELAPGSEELAEEPAAVDDAPQPEAEEAAEPAEDAAADETDAEQVDVETEVVDYSLFVPGPNGYELVPQTGVPPQPGETVELVLPDREEPAVFEVVRSGRTLPGGDVCVYLAQV